MGIFVADLDPCLISRWWWWW